MTASNAANAFPGTFGLTPPHTSHSFLRLIATHWDSLGCRFFVKSFTRMPTPPDDKSKFESLRSAGLLLAIPTLLIVSPLVGFFIGMAMDRWLKTKLVFSIVGMVLGFAAAGRETWRIIRRVQDEEEESKRR